MVSRATRYVWAVGIVAAVVLASLVAVISGPLRPVPTGSGPGGTAPGPTVPPNLPNPGTPGGGTSSGPVTVLAGWEGIQYGSNHGVLDYVDPPDVPLAVGSNHVFELTNGLGILWTTSGSFVQTVNPQSLFQVSATDGIGDARVVYDGLSGRWFASAADFTTGDVVLAVSTTGDPTGTWRAFSFATGQGCPDQPWMGLTSDKVVLSLNTFAACDGTFTGGMFWAINKTDLVSGATPRFTTFGPNLNFLNIVPVQAMTPATTAYMAWPIQPNYVRVFTLTGVPPVAVTLAYHDYSVSNLSNAPNAVQPDPNYTLRTGDNRVRDGFWSAGRLWITYNDGCVPTGDTLSRACVRLTQLDTTNQTVLQDFDVGLANAYTFYPAIRTDGGGNLVVVFGLSSATVYPSVEVASRAPSDTLNTLGPWTTLRAGTGSRTPTSGSCSSGVCRYGDYFGVAVDPSNTSRVWTAGEYGNTTGWGTYISEVGASSPSPPPPPVPPSVVTESAGNVSSSGATLRGNLTSLGTATSVTVGFHYGTSPALSGATNVTVGTQSAPGGFAQAISGLSASTTYYFRAWASGQGFATGSTLSFTTLAPPPVPPSVSTGAATGVNQTAATLQGSLTAMGTAPTVTVGFLWGTSPALSGAANVSVGSLGAAGPFSDALTGLAPNTTYYFRAWANGQGFATGTILSFTTLATPPPGTVFLTFSYSIVGGGSGASAPILSYVQGGLSKTATLTTSATSFTADLGTAWSVTNPLGGSGASERWMTNQAVSGTASASITTVFSYYHQYAVTFAFSVLGGGSGYTAPSVTFAAFGATAATSPGTAIWADSGSGYQFQNPLTGSTGTEAWRSATASGTVSGSQTLTATYYHQFLVTFLLSVANGNAPSTNPTVTATVMGATTAIAIGTSSWVDANASYAYPATIVGATGERWQAGSSPTGLVTAAGSIAATYYHEYSLALSYQVTGGGSGYSAPSVQCVQTGLALTVSAGSSTWMDAGSWYQYALRLPGSTSSERWLTAIPGGTVLGSGTVTVSYEHQFLVDFNYSVTGGGSGYSAPNVTYSNLSAQAVSLAGAAWVWGDAGAKYQFQNPLPGSTSTNGWRTNNGGGTVSSSTTYTATYRHQYKLRFKTTSLSGTPTPVTPLINATVFGTLVGIPSGAEAWVDAGGTYDFPGVFYGPQAGERWTTYTPASGTVLGPMNLTAAYVHQYYLTVLLNSRDGGSLSVSSSWYNETTPLILLAQATSGWQFQGWVGSGNGSYTGASSSASIAMNGPVTETAVFYVGLTLTASSGGSLQYAYGGSSGSVPAGSSETLYVPPGTNVTVNAAPSWFYQFDAWSGDESASAPTLRVSVTSPQSVSAVFGISLYSKMDSVFGIVLAVVAVLLLLAVVRQRRRKRKLAFLRAARARSTLRPQSSR